MSHADKLQNIINKYIHDYCMTDVDTPETREAFKPLIVKHTFHDKSLTQDEMESMLVIFCDHAQFDEMIKSGFQHNNELKQTNSKVNNKTDDDKTDGVDANPMQNALAYYNREYALFRNKQDQFTEQMTYIRDTLQQEMNDLLDDDHHYKKYMDHEHLIDLAITDIKRTCIAYGEDTDNAVTALRHLQEAITDEKTKYIKEHYFMWNHFINAINKELSS